MMTNTLTKVPLRCSWAEVHAIVEPCIDADLWSWAIVVDGGTFDSSYADDREEAIRDAKARWTDHLAEVAS